MKYYDRTDSLNFITRRLSQKIVIEVDLGVFTFMSSKIEHSIPTYVYVTVRRGHLKVVSVGKEALGEPNALRVALFENNPNLFAEVDKCECVEAFIKYGVLKVISRYAMVRPTIIFRHIQVFNPIFQGYEKAFFNLIASRACAGAVFFE